MISCSCDKSLSHFIHWDSEKCTSWKIEAMSVIMLVVWRQQNKLKCVWQVFLNLLDGIPPENVKITKQNASCCFFPTFGQSVQNLLLSSKICLKNSCKIGSFYCSFIFYFLFQFAMEIPLRKFPWNLPFFPQLCLWKSHKIWIFGPQPIRSPEDTRLMSQVTHQAGFCGINERDAILM